MRRPWDRAPPPFCACVSPGAGTRSARSSSSARPSGCCTRKPGTGRAGHSTLSSWRSACAGLGEVFDRALLRETLQRHRGELQSALQWIGGRLASLAADGELGGPTAGAAPDGDAVAELTARELEVLALMARGQTNAAIARALVVQEGTVKYHVKNVLRKLGARSRADAVAPVRKSDELVSVDELADLRSRLAEVDARLGGAGAAAAQHHAAEMAELEARFNERSEALARARAGGHGAAQPHLPRRDAGARARSAVRRNAL